MVFSSEVRLRVCFAAFAWLVAGLADALAATPAPGAMAGRIDALLAASWKQAAVPPAEVSSDAEFMRRVHLDLTGRIPTVNEARQFLAEDSRDKRTQLVDHLLARPAYANHMARTWRRFLLPENNNLVRFGNGATFEIWLADQFADNTPYDQLTRELLLATGQYNQGPALFYAALQAKPEELAAATSRSLLGVQIQCAQCHDHPFDHWTERDFWGYAAFFAQLQKPNNPQQRFVTQVDDLNTGELKLPDTGVVIAPTFLGGDEVEDSADATRRERLADWVTARDNPYFARAAVNRIWAHLFGRGIVDPVDDLGEHNTPSHPQLLNELTDYFVATNYDVRNLVRTLAMTRAYQLSSESIAGASPRPELFARMAIKALTAEQLYDCLLQATARRQNAANRGFNSSRNVFLNKFRAPGGSSTEFHSGIPQALTLMNGDEVRSAIDLEESDILVGLTAPFLNDEQRVEALFLATLSRHPNEEEQGKFVAYVTDKKAAADKRRALGDILWALLNSAEFCLNH